MKNTFGMAISVTLFGESHGAYIGAVIDGLSPGIAIDEEYIAEKMDLRRAYGKLSTARHEEDKPEFVSGVFEGRTTGTPLTILIKNGDTKSKDYSKLKDMPRPSHADYTAERKYLGYQDYRGGGHFSGRITAALVASGAVLQSALEQKGIYIGTHIASCHGVCDRQFNESDYMTDIKALSGKQFAVLDDGKAEAMKAEIENVAAEGDSVGGILETVAVGIPAGLGEPWFDSLESEISHIVFSVPAVKGIEFGLGFGFADCKGSEANDAFRYEDGKVVTATNNNGGINGGISNGMPVVFRTVIKPTPSIFKAQDTVDLAKGENADLTLEGRHDPAIIHRARVVIDAVTAIAIADLMTARFGTNVFTPEEKK